MKTKIFAWVSVLVLALTFHARYSQAIEEYGTAPDEAGTFQGKIIEIKENALAIEKTDEEVVRVPLPGETGKSPAAFRLGELVEITMTPGGLTTSVIPVPGGFEP